MIVADSLPVGLYESPICWGGTFKDIAQRAWSDPDKLMEMSASFCQKMGLIDSADTNEFVQQFCKLDVTGSELRG